MRSIYIVIENRTR